MIATSQPLSEVFAGLKKGDPFSVILNDYVDRFRENPFPELLAVEPAILAASLDDRGLADAWLAATTVTLSQEQGYQIPAWAKADERRLANPWFAAKTPNLKAILLQESPAAFRVRNLFVSANVLSRA